MVLILKEGASKKELADLEKKIYVQKDKIGFDAKVYNGAISLQEDPLIIQNKLRDEWERNPG